MLIESKFKGKCKKVTEETSRRRTFIFMNPRSFRIRQDKVTTFGMSSQAWAAQDFQSDQDGEKWDRDSVVAYWESQFGKQLKGEKIPTGSSRDKPSKRAKTSTVASKETKDQQAKDKVCTRKRTCKGAKETPAHDHVDDAKKQAKDDGKTRPTKRTKSDPEVPAQRPRRSEPAPAEDREPTPEPTADRPDPLPRDKVFKKISQFMAQVPTLKPETAEMVLRMRIGCVNTCRYNIYTKRPASGLHCRAANKDFAYFSSSLRECPHLVRYAATLKAVEILAT